MLNLNFNFANKSVSIVAGILTYTLTLTGDTWVGTDSANVTGNGTATLTVTAAGTIALSTINITDSAAGTAVNFIDSGASLYAATFNISLDDAAAGTIAFTAGTRFTGTAALSASTSRNIVVNPGAGLETSVGGITLEANQQVVPTTAPPSSASTSRV